MALKTNTQLQTRDSDRTCLETALSRPTPRMGPDSGVELRTRRKFHQHMNLQTFRLCRTHYTSGFSANGRIINHVCADRQWSFLSCQAV
jgi:hypothetical protein